MTGTFELFHDEDHHFRFRLTAPDGTIVALSTAFPNKAAAVAGITAVREYAGMGLITDLCPDIPLHAPPPQSRPAAQTTNPDRRPAGPHARPGHIMFSRKPHLHRVA